MTSPVDYVISAIPAKYTPELIADCARKGVKAVHMFTSGFSEIEDSIGQELQDEIVAIARRTGIRLIGPNGMGLYCPRTGLTFSTGFPKQSGQVGYISQSGGNSMYAVREAASRGLYFSKVISHGNACDLDETDFIEYLAQDPETRIIAAYIEGVKDGRRFARALFEATRIKPVIVFKGGATKAGARAATSHTSAIAGEARIWSGLLKQARAIQVYDIDEMVDVALLFSTMSIPKSRNIALIGLGGGATVQAADACASAGLEIPLLPAEVRQKLGRIYGSEAGAIFRNPVDLYPFPPDGQQAMEKAIETIATSPSIDSLIVHLPLDITPMSGVGLIQLYVKSLVNLKDRLNHRTAVVIHYIVSVESHKAASEAQSTLVEAGYAVFPSVSRAAIALSQFIRHCQIS